MLKRVNYYKGRATLIGGRVLVRASRWPWMKRTSVALMSGPDEKIGERYGWKPTKGTGRFGGGWNWKLGIAIGGSTVMLDLLFGMVTISWGKYTMEQVRRDNP